MPQLLFTTSQNEKFKFSLPCWVTESTSAGQGNTQPAGSTEKQNSRAIQGSFQPRLPYKHSSLLCSFQRASVQLHRLLLQPLKPRLKPTVVYKRVSTNNYCLHRHHFFRHNIQDWLLSHPKKSTLGYNQSRLCHDFNKPMLVRKSPAQHKPTAAIQQCVGAWCTILHGSSMKPDLCSIFMVTYGIEQAIIFLSCGFFLSFFPSPNLSRWRLDVYNTFTHGVALARI